MVADRSRMDRVKFDASLEIIERLLSQKADEIGNTRKVMLKGGLMKFDTARLVNDLKCLIEEIEMMSPQGFVESYPLDQNQGQPSTVDE
jgi:hypothetical protein